jgi:tRNA(Ile)-lysidine synthase
MKKNLLAIMAHTGLPTDEPIVVGCSGGADSMALTLMLAEYCKISGNSMLAVTVDHALRKESASEARKVKEWLTKRSIEHTVLTWQGPKPKSNIQEVARKARYALLAEFCVQQKAHHLVLAHTKEDQAETFLLRLARGSGVDGLSCMAPVSRRNGITLLRPLLHVSKAELIAYLKRKKQAYVDDPSNTNTKYDRVKFRNAMPALSALGITVEKLASTAQAMRRARVSLEAATQAIMSEAVSFYPEGYALIKPFVAPEEITLRILAHLVMYIGGHEVKPRLEETEQLHRALQHKPFKGATLGGCQFIAHKGNILVCRELHAVQPPVSASAKQWDNRFFIEAKAPKGWTIGALTQGGWLSIAKRYKLSNPYPDKRILYTLPTLRDETGLVQAVPHLGVSVDKAKFSTKFKAVSQYRSTSPADR